MTADTAVIMILGSFTGLYALFVLAVVLSAICTDLTYPWPKGMKRNPMFHYANKKRAKRKGRKV